MHDDTNQARAIDQSADLPSSQSANQISLGTLGYPAKPRGSSLVPLVAIISPVGLEGSLGELSTKMGFRHFRNGRRETKYSCLLGVYGVLQFKCV